MSEFSPLPAQAQQLAKRMAAGESARRAAMDLELDLEAVQLWMEHPDFDLLLKSYLPSEAQIRDKFQSLTAPAIATLESLMRDTGTEASTRKAIAQDILDRAGYTPVKRVSILTFKPSDARERLVRDIGEELKE